MEIKEVQPYGIETPKTIKEFRENLKKYYFTIGKDELYVMGLEDGKDSIKIDELDSLSDLYDHSLGTPLITPIVKVVKDFGEYMKETGQVFSCNDYFMDEDNYQLFEDQFEFLDDDPKWIGIDNQIYREFFYLTLGEFSGYVFE